MSTSDTPLEASPEAPGSPGASAPAGAIHLPLADQAAGPATPTVHTTHTVTESDLDALAAVATVLSRWLIAPPDGRTLAAACAPEMLAQWPLPDRDATARGLREFAQHRETGETAEDVAADFMALFVGPGHVPASPYESVHRSVEGLLFEEQTLQVRDWYKKFGLSAPREGKEPDDHIALELEFVATLLAAGLEAFEAGDEDDASLFVQAAGEFSAAHLRAWAPELFGIMLKGARTAFHRGLAHLGLGFLEELAAKLPATTTTTPTDQPNGSSPPPK